MVIIRFFVRVLLLPFRVALATSRVMFRAGTTVGKAPFKLGGKTIRLVGFRGWFFGLLGLAIGLLLAPMAGRELRARIAAMLDAGIITDDELEAKVVFELAHAPRTWHLPQPSVSVQGAWVTLSGSVAADDDREELSRVAAAIPGVSGVDNQLAVAEA